MRLLPDMHRVAEGKSDWENIAPEDRNPYQQRAAETNGWDTPGMRATLEGFIATTAGIVLQAQDARLCKALGTSLIAFGRKRDLDDGKRADETGTKSQLGADVEASADTGLAIIAGLVLTRTGVIPKREAQVNGSLLLLKGGAVALNKRFGGTPRTSRVGKLQAFGVWGSTGLRCIADTAEAFDQPRIAVPAKTAGDKIARASTVLNFISTAGYVRDAIQSGTR